MSEAASVFSLNIPSRWTLQANSTLVVDGERRILVDPGCFDNVSELNGVLQKTVQMEISDITDVFYTHLHYDHYHPLILDNQELCSHIPKIEYDYIKTLMQHNHDATEFKRFLLDTHDLIAPVFLRQFFYFANDPRYQLDVVMQHNAIHLCAPGDELSPHITLIDLPGHCPGQLGLEVITDYGICIIAGDAVICLQDFSAVNTQHHLIIYNREKLLDSRKRVAQADFVIPGHDGWFNPKNLTSVNFQENTL